MNVQKSFVFYFLYLLWEAGMDQIFVGDFNVLKTLFNHPDVQNRGQ
jgi:hypothetical protein